MNSENSKTSHPQRLLLKLTDEFNLRRGEKVLPYRVLPFAIHEKIEKAHIETIHLKYQVQLHIQHYFQCIIKKHEAC